MIALLWGVVLAVPSVLAVWAIGCWGGAAAHERCDVPLFGWRCSRERGHGGPCAARPRWWQRP